MASSTTSEGPARAPGAEPRPAWVAALGVALLMQTVSACLTRVFPVLAPALTEAAGVPESSIGLLASVGSAGTMLWLVLGNGVMAQLGAVRTLQLGAVLGVAGLLLATGGGWPALLAASLLIGLGYGPSPPAGSDLLRRYAPARHRSLVFSIKQSGVPLGGAVAGIAVPLLLQSGNWRWACLGIALPALAATLLSEAFRRRIDPPGPRRFSLRAALGPAQMAAPFRLLARRPALLGISYVSLGFAVAQGSVFAFLVLYLTARQGFTLAEAGTAFAAMQGAGVAGRILVGWLADRMGSARRMLVLLAFASAAVTALLAAVGPAWPPAAVVGLSALGGIAIASWNGVFMAEVSSLVPEPQVGEATAATTFVTFIGYVLGPALVGACLALGTGYGPAFLAVALLPFSGGLVLLGTAARPS
ncbi:MFS transporter [Teichococcus aestuarii]|uniref:MFS transporter n=1 Tax=Teichococcus aestuarii TaxID=568898 RepID=UPI0036213364